MTTLSNISRAPDGTALSGVEVTAVLVDSTGSQVVGYTEDGSVVGKSTATSDSTGTWSLTLVANSTITPENTYYSILEKPSAGGSFQHGVVLIPDSGTVSILDVLVDEPVPLDASVMVAHLAAANPHPQYALAADTLDEAAIEALIAAVVDGAPGALDTLNEIAAALGDDANYAGTITTQLTAKVNKSTLDANSILYAVTDDTPAALTVAASRIVGRKSTGDIGALTAAEVKAILSLAAADISDFNTAVRTSTLNQMTAPTADLSVNTHKITNVSDGTVSSDAANLGQLTTHAADTTLIHGITDTSKLVTSPDGTALTVALGTTDPGTVALFFNTAAESPVTHGHRSATRIETMLRQEATASIVPTAGNAFFSYFTPDTALTISKLGVHSGGSSAATGTTLARLGLFTVDGSNNLTLVARSASNTSLLAAVDTVYEEALATTGGYPASYALLANTRYAIGLLLVGNTNGQFKGAASNAAFYTMTPRMNGRDTGETDLATSYTVAAFTNTASMGWFWAAA